MISVPHFVLALVLVLVFSVHLKWLPVAGYTPQTEDPVKNLPSLALPVLTVAFSTSGLYQRLLRNDMSGTLREDYIAMAEAKGLSPSRILVRHALRPSLFSLITLVGLTTAAALGGATIVESIFALPGIGRLVLDSIKLHDLVVVQGVVAFVAVVYVVVNGVVDILYAVLDPRIRRGH
jgi:peptide/nickel transport system permease protein